MLKLVLASKSPRRAELLKLAGYDFEIDPPAVREDVPCTAESAGEAVKLVALKKARSVVGRHENAVVLSADTVVICGGKVLGKPRDEREAFEMLSLLSGKAHEVVTGVALVEAATNAATTFHETSRVVFKELSKEEVEAYVKSGEPLGKAGAYAIQGKAALFVKRVEGCFYNVVGLPLARVYVELSKFGIRPRWAIS